LGSPVAEAPIGKVEKSAAELGGTVVQVSGGVHGEDDDVQVDTAVNCTGTRCVVSAVEASVAW
jgi:hypothetical protein